MCCWHGVSEELGDITFLHGDKAIFATEFCVVLFACTMDLEQRLVKPMAVIVAKL